MIIYILQDHQSVRERVCGRVRAWRRLSQLPSRVPVGLQSGRTGRLQSELHNRVYRFLRQSWMGVRLEIGVAADRREARQTDGRWLAFSLGMGRS